MSMVVKVSVMFAVTQSTHALGANSADALFLLGYGVEFLPRMILISGFAVMAALLMHSVGLSRWRARRWLPLASVLAGVIGLADFGLAIAVGRGAYPVIWIMTQVLIVSSFIVMWNAAAASSTTRQAKRLYPLYASAGVLGAIVGNLATGILAAALGTESLLGLQGAGLLFAALVMRMATAEFRTERITNRPKAITELTSIARLVASDRLLKRSAALAFALSILFFLVVFPFNEAAAAAFETEVDLARFLGLFATAATVTTFIVSLLATSRLLARLGIVGSLLLLPIVYALGFGLWLVSFTLVTATLVRAFQWVTGNAVGGTASTALFNVLPGERRGQVMSFMTAVPAQLGIVVGGVILIMTSGSSSTVRLAIGLALALVTLVVAYRMRPAYVDSVVAAVGRGLSGVLSAPHQGLVSPLGRETASVLMSHLHGPQPEDRLVALQVFTAAGVPIDMEMIDSLVEASDERVRLAVLAHVVAVRPNRTRSLVQALMQDNSPVVRGAALDALAPGDPLAHEFLQDPDSAVSAKAARLVGGPIGRRVLEDLLASNSSADVAIALEEGSRSNSIVLDAQRFLRHEDPRVRAAALSAGGHLATDDMAGLLDDPSVVVRRLAARRLKSSPKGIEILYQSLDDGSVSATDAALDALTPVNLFREDFLDWAQREANRARWLSTLRIAIEDDDSPATVSLAKVLDVRCERLTDWVLIAMTTSELAPTMALVRRGIRADDEDTRSQAIEALEAVATHKVAKPLLALLEPSQETDVPDTADALQKLSADFDPWISRLATMALSDSTSGMDDISIQRVERVIALQRVPMLSGLDPEDLDLIAAAVSETHFGPNEPIYRAGDEGHEMLVIIDGEAVVTARHGSETREIARYGSGQVTGELALLRRSTRTADVHAGPTGLSGLVISDRDLKSVLEERPNVAVAMLATLAGRLADQA